jgi:hypothetical protein
MKRTALFALVGTTVLASGAFAQSATTPPLPADTQTTQSSPAQKADPAATPNTAGAPKTQQSKPAEKQKAYTGNTGKKKDAGTACSSARPRPNGGVDCGTSGNSATAGKVPK